MINIFNEDDVIRIIDRMNELTPESKPEWGKMNVAQMLAHCNVTYEMVYEDIHPKPKGLKKWILKRFVRPIVVGEKPYSRNGRTASQFIIKTDKDFEAEKNRLADYLHKTKGLGEDHFHLKRSHSFGVLTSSEWNILFAKHLDHHLQQFGV